MKSVVLSVLQEKVLRIRDKFNVEIPDDGSTIDAIAVSDKKLKEILKDQKFPINNMNNLLHLLWNPKSGKFYEDLGIDAHGPNNEFLPIEKDPFLSLPNDSIVYLTPDAGC